MSRVKKKYATVMTSKQSQPSSTSYTVWKMHNKAPELVYQHPLSPSTGTSCIVNIQFCHSNI